jgi:hypothetical protein
MGMEDVARTSLYSFLCHEDGLLQRECKLRLRLQASPALLFVLQRAHRYTHVLRDIIISAGIAEAGRAMTLV